MSNDNEGETTTWDVDDRSRKWPGVAAVALFAVLAVVFAGAPFGDPASGFAGEAGVVASMGYALFNIQAPGAIPSEGFLVSFLTIAVVLDAALDGAVLLARRDEGGEITTALRSDAAQAVERVVATDGGERGSASRTSEDARSGSSGSDTEEVND